MRRCLAFVPRRLVRHGPAKLNSIETLRVQRQLHRGLPRRVSTVRTACQRRTRKQFETGCEMIVPSIGTNQSRKLHTSNPPLSIDTHPILFPHRIRIQSRRKTRVLRFRSTILASVATRRTISLHRLQMPTRQMTYWEPVSHQIPEMHCLRWGRMHNGNGNEPPPRPVKRASKRLSIHIGRYLLMTSTRRQSNARSVIKKSMMSGV